MGLSFFNWGCQPCHNLHSKHVPYFMKLIITDNFLIPNTSVVVELHRYLLLTLIHLFGQWPIQPALFNFLLPRDFNMQNALWSFQFFDPCPTSTLPQGWMGKGKVCHTSLICKNLHSQCHDSNQQELEVKPLSYSVYGFGCDDFLGKK